MAGAGWSGVKLLAVAALLWGATVALAQSPESGLAGSQAGSLAGRLTDLHSKPVKGATVTVRNEATGAEARTTTQKNGTYRFSGLEPGEYTLRAESPQLGRGQVEGIVVLAGHEARVQTALNLQSGATAPELAGLEKARSPKSGAIEPAVRPFVAKQAAEKEETESEWPQKHASGAKAPIDSVGMMRELKPPPPSESSSSLASETGSRQIRPTSAEEKSATATASQTPPLEPVSGSPVVEAPATEHAALTATVAAEPLETLALSGQRLPEMPREMPETVALALTATVAEEPLEALALPERNAADSALRQAAAGGETVPGALNAVEPVAETSTLTAGQLQALPASGRRWQDFVLDTQAGAAGKLGQTAERPSTFGVDGASLGLAFGGAGGSGQGSHAQGGRSENLAGRSGNGQTAMGQPWTGGHGFAMGEAAIREVRTAAGNVEARASRSGGGRMNVETERGANGLHGQGFIFDRQNNWGAKNPFTQWVGETASATLSSVPAFTAEAYTPSDHETTWGLGLGSQIRKNKLFWFAAVDSNQRNDPGLATVKHPDKFFLQPTNDQMQVLSARLGLSSVNPVAEGLAAYSKMLETLDGLLGPAPRTNSQWVGFARLDWQAAERHRFTLEGIGARWNSPGGGLTRVSETYGNHSFGSSEASEEWLLGRWETFITPNLLAVSQGSAGREILDARPETPSTYEQTLLAGNAWGQLPQIVVDNRYGFTIGNPSRFGQGSYPDEHLYQGQEMLDWVRGNLLVKAGFDASHNTDATSLLRNQTGTYTYSSVENFISDALVFQNPQLRADPLDPFHQHNCDQTGKVWRDSTGQLHGLGYLPCYSYYSQTLGPTNWWLSTEDWAGYTTAQWQPKKQMVVSLGLRFEREQLPPPIAKVNNPELPLTEKLPNLGSNWGPRLGLALGSGNGHWPLLRLGYGMYFGRTENATLETALTQTGSLKGDLNFFLRPTDDLPNNGGGAPPFPYVLTGTPGSVVKPGAVEFAPNFRNPEIHQAVAAVEETLPGHVELTASAEVSLGRRLPIAIDTNIDSAAQPQTITYAVVDGTGLGPLKTAQITVPFYTARLNPDYQQITQILSRANSTYEAILLKVVRNGRRGLSMRAHYTYAHAMDWNPNESIQISGSDVLDPADFKQEYGTGNLDVRHSAAATLIYEAPWKLRSTAGKLANGWILSGIGQFHSGLPYTMRTSGSLAKEFKVTSGAAIAGLGPGMNGSGGDNRVYGIGSDNRSYGIGRNTYRYPAAWKADLRLARRFNLGHMRQLELLAESFNLFNHRNVTELETTGYYLESGSTDGTMPTLNFLNGLKANTTAFGQPLNVNATNFYRERQFQVGLRFRF
jgi:hypothetical protein